MQIRKLVREIVEKEILGEANFFKNIFGKKEEEPADSDEKNPKSSKVEKLGEDKYRINKNLINKINIEDTGFSAYESFINEMENIPTLSWLFSGKFYAQYISINPKTQKVTVFIGEWYDGEFKGDLYTMYSNMIKVIPEHTGFEGGVFNGKNFNMPYQYWKTSPKNFINGTISNSEDGLLGLPNVTSNQEEKFNLIQVPVGYHINIKTQGDATTYAIRVDKRLDKNSADFIFTNINTGIKKTVSWQTIRKNFDKLYLFKGKKILNIEGILSLDSQITSISIESPSFSAEDLAKKQLAGLKKAKAEGISLNFANIPDNKFSQLGSIKATPSTPEAVNYISALRKDFENGGKQFLSNLTDIRTELIHVGIDADHIPDDLRFVTNMIRVINKDELSEANRRKPTYTSIDDKELPEDLLKNMRYLENFYNYFIKNIPNQVEQDEVVKKIKAFLSNQFETKPKPEEKKPIFSKGLGL